MNGQWFYDSARDIWSMVIQGRHEMSLSGAALRALRERTGATAQELLAWVATRPTGPWQQQVA